MIIEIKDSKEKQAIARKILEALTDWFEVEESREGTYWWMRSLGEDNDRGREVGRGGAVSYCPLETRSGIRPALYITQ